MNMNKGFTLTELLITIAILAILAAAVTIVLNPGELLAQARDSRRAGELNSLVQTIGLHASSVIGGYRGTANRVYISLPDSSVNCGTHLASLPTLPAGWEYRCSTIANFRRSDGTGWLPHNFNAMRGGSPFNELPVDPINNTTHYYTYVTGTGWALSSLLESERHLKLNALRDGGTDPGRIELGTNLNLLTRASGLVGYWPMDGSFNDASGNNNHGTGQGFGAVNPFTTGRQGQAGNFDGVDDFVQVPDHSSLRPSHISIEAWVQPISINRDQMIMGKGDGMATGAGYNFVIYSHNRPAFWIYDGVGALRLLDFGHTASSNQWQHLLYTFDGATARSYINGIHRTSLSITGFTHNSSIPLTIGGFLWGWRFHGLIDEVRIYNRALSATEVRAIFNATR